MSAPHARTTLISGHANDLCVLRSHTQAETLSLGRLASFRRGRKRCCCLSPTPGPGLTPPSLHLFPLSARHCHAAGRAGADKWRVCEPTVYEEVTQIPTHCCCPGGCRRNNTVLPHCLVKWEQRDTRSNKIINREVRTINWQKISIYILVQNDSCPSQLNNEQASQFKTQPSLQFDLKTFRVLHFFKIIFFFPPSDIYFHRAKRCWNYVIANVKHCQFLIYMKLNVL